MSKLQDECPLRQPEISGYPSMPGQRGWILPSGKGREGGYYPQVRVGRVDTIPGEGRKGGYYAQVRTGRVDIILRCGQGGWMLS